MARRDRSEQQAPPQQPYPPQGYPPQGGYPPPPAPPKKRRKWPFILGGIVALIVIIAVASSRGGGGATDTAAPGSGAQQPAPAGQAEQPAAPQGITYEVTGETGGSKSGANIKTSVTYTSSKNFNQSQENGVTLPWTKTVDLGNGFFSGASLVAQAGDGVTSITCRIKDGNEVISENTSTGQFAVVTCSGT